MASRHGLLLPRRFLTIADSSRCIAQCNRSQNFFTFPHSLLFLSLCLSLPLLFSFSFSFSLSLCLFLFSFSISLFFSWIYLLLVNVFISMSMRIDTNAFIVFLLFYCKQLVLSFDSNNIINLILINLGYCYGITRQFLWSNTYSIYFAILLVFKFWLYSKSITDLNETLDIVFYYQIMKGTTFSWIIRVSSLFSRSSNKYYHCLFWLKIAYI